MTVRHEIERKYLVDELPADLGSWPAQDLAQGYLAIEQDGTEVRLRRTGRTATLTVKKAGGLVRVEEEVPLDPAAFERLWPLTEGRRVVKTRHAVTLAGGVVVEVDVYSGDLAGLAVAEVEFPTVEEADSFRPPHWMGAEVTADRGYKNQSLALWGVPQR